MKVISLNIQEGKNFNQVAEFLVQHKPELVLLQEALRYQVEELGSKLGMSGCFGPMNRDAVESKVQRGNAILSKKKLQNIFGDKLGGFDQTKTTSSSFRNLEALLVGGEHPDLGVVATTHLPWSYTPDEDPEQEKALSFLLRCLENRRVLLLGVDVNNAREKPNGQKGKIWQAITRVLSDFVPITVTTTLDQSHRFSDQPTVLDGLFAKFLYCRVLDLSLHSCGSDHMALVAEVPKSYP